MGLLSATNLVAVYSVLIGFMMIGMWISLLSTAQVPELHERPKELAFHLAAEFLTAILLIISGIGLLLKNDWARMLSLIALGMLLYTVIMSAGYYAHQGNTPMVAMFVALTILTILAIVVLLKFS